MILKADQIVSRLASKSDAQKADPLAIIPSPDPEKMLQKGSASVDLRLGTWFTTMRQHRVATLDIGHEKRAADRNEGLRKQLIAAGLSQEGVLAVNRFLPRMVPPSEGSFVKMHYVPFGGDFILHPHSFVLGVTLEWIRLPRNLAGYVIGKSSWGRRGLIIATAAGVHPGFTGCLTLELSNVGEIPVAMEPGMTICQLFLHNVQSESHEVHRGSFSCTRRPVLGRVEPDEFATQLALANRD